MNKNQIKNGISVSTKLCRTAINSKIVYLSEEPT